MFYIKSETRCREAVSFPYKWIPNRTMAAVAEWDEASDLAQTWAWA